MRASHIFHIVFAVFAMLACLPNAARAEIYGRAPANPNDLSWCRPAVVPSVKITSDTDRIKWVYGKSKKQLDQQQIDTINPYGNNVITDVGGLMQGGIKMEERMQFGTLTNQRTNQTCMYYNSIEMSFHIYPTIYIASEYRQGTCMHNAIRQHELKHIATDRDIVNKYSRAVGIAIQNEIKRQNVYGPVPADQVSAVQQQMKARMEQILTSYSDAMDAERRSRQQKIDSLAEYERVNNLCSRR